MSADYTLTDRFYDGLTALLYVTCRAGAWVYNRTIGRVAERYMEEI